MMQDYQSLNGELQLPQRQTKQPAPHTHTDNIIQQLNTLEHQQEKHEQQKTNQK